MKREPSLDSPRIPPVNPNLNTPLLKALRDYEGLNRRRFHGPGHAGLPLVNSLLGEIPGLPPEIYRYDQTEVEGLDVLSEPSECLLEAQQAAAVAFGVQESYFLVNGSTSGLMAAMLATLRPGDSVLLPRNVHRSIISGLILTGAEPLWFLPDWLEEWGLWSGIRPEQVKALLDQYLTVRALVLPSPTYEGLGSDVQQIGTLCRERGVYFIVDEAHGSLWSFSEALPPSACQAPCDVVVQSLHKTAGSLTQSSMAHLPKGSRVDPLAFQQALNTVQTTSPSYLLMASLDATRAFLASDVGQGRVQSLLTHVQTLRARIQAELKAFELFEPASEDQWLWDPTKLYLRSRYEPGDAWAVRVEAERQLTYEAKSPYGSLYWAVLGLEPEDYDFFFQVFQAEEKAYQAQGNLSLFQVTCPPVPLPDKVLLPREAFFAPGKQVPRAQALGGTAKETIVHCPPGIPVLMPGERIQHQHQPYLPELIWVVA